MDISEDSSGFTLSEAVRRSFEQIGQNYVPIENQPIHDTESFDDTKPTNSAA